MANAEKIQFNTPVGRIISGSLTEQNKHAYDSKAPNGRGAELPQEKWYYWFRVAFLKNQTGGTHGDINGLLNTMYQHAWKGYQNNPGIVARLQSGPMDPHSTFAWKVEDGDAIGPDGKRKFGDEASGCWLLSYRSTYPIKCANALANNAECPPATIKRGYYVDIFTSCSINEQTDHTAGIYLNPQIVRLVGYGEEISGGISIAAAYGNAPAPQLPPGASAVPVAGGAMPSPTAPPALGAPMPPGAPAGYAMPPGAPMPGQYGAPPAMAPQPTAYPGNQPPAPAPAPMPGQYAPQPGAAPMPGQVQPYPQIVPGYQPPAPAPQPGAAPMPGQYALQPGAAPMPGMAPMPQR